MSEREHRWVGANWPGTEDGSEAVAREGLTRRVLLRRGLSAGLGMAGAAWLLPGCGGGEEPAAEGTDGGDTRLPKREVDLLDLEPVKPAKPYRLGVAVPQFRDPYWVSVAYGCVDEADRWGAELVRCFEAGSYLNLDEQIAQMENLAQLGVDAILFGPNDYVATAAVVDDLVGRGIEVVNIGNLTKSDNIAMAVTYDMWGYGVAAADFIGEQVNGTGKVVMLSGPAGASWSEDRAAGFRARIEEKFSGIEIAGDQTSNVDRLEGQRITEDWLQRLGDDFGAVFTVVNLLAEGAVLALEEAGRAGDTVVVTSASTPDTIRMLQEGSIQWVSSEPGALTGRWGVQYAFRVLNGDDLELPEKPEHAPDSPENLVYLPTPIYTTEDVTAETPYKYDWAPRGWSPTC